MCFFSSAEFALEAFRKRIAYLEQPQSQPWITDIFNSMSPYPPRPIHIYSTDKQVQMFQLWQEGQETLKREGQFYPNPEQWNALEEAYQKYPYDPMICAGLATMMRTTEAKIRHLIHVQLT